MNRQLQRLACAVAIGIGILSPAPALAASKEQLIGQAEYYLSEFEKEVARQRGGEKAVWRSKQDALSRVQALKEQYPDDAKVEEMFQRTKAALMKSKGDFIEITPEMTAYLQAEDKLRQEIAALGKKTWDDKLAEYRDKLLEKPFPTPDYKQVGLEELTDKYVVLDDIQYPQKQFYGITGEYVATGKPSTGYYFVNIDGRDWLGPYEAVKRFRRQVDTGLDEVKSWSVLARISNITSENPDPSEKKVGTFHFGWVVTPVALYVPGHVMAYATPDGDHTGAFVGEDEVARIKNSQYSVSSVPDNATPEQLMNIFVTAIKEKNYDLYQACIYPDRYKEDIGQDELRYHWDLHQGRFHGEYVHVTIEQSAKISVVKGFDDKNDAENFFLDDKQKAALNQVSGPKIEEAVVETRAWNQYGKSVGSPKQHRLRRENGGRWYIYDYAPRF